MKTNKDVVLAGGVLVEHKSGQTWNDGGHWNTWIYVFPETQEYIQVHQPTDYRSEFEVTKVVPIVETVVTYKPKKEPS